MMSLSPLQIDHQHEYVAIKALTKSHLKEDMDDDDEDREERSRSQSHPQRHQIITGFNNLKKELSILSPLHHENIVELIGVTLTPLGLVLELAPRGSLRSILKEFAITSTRLQPAAIQAVIIQVGVVMMSSNTHYNYGCCQEPVDMRGKIFYSDIHSIVIHLCMIVRTIFVVAMMS